MTSSRRALFALLGVAALIVVSATLRGRRDADAAAAPASEANARSTAATDARTPHELATAIAESARAAVAAAS
jgi:hypothetical protein